MAVEAAKQAVRGARHITEFNLKEVFFQAPLVIPTNAEGVETQFSLSAPQDAPWLEFHLYSLTTDVWVDNCHGSIQIEYGEEDVVIDGGKEKKEQLRLYQHMFRARSEACPMVVDL